MGARPHLLSLYIVGFVHPRRKPPAKLRVALMLGYRQFNEIVVIFGAAKLATEVNGKSVTPAAWVGDAC